MAKALLELLANPPEWADRERDREEARAFLASEQARAEASKVRTRVLLDKAKAMGVEW